MMKRVLKRGCLRPFCLSFVALWLTLGMASAEAALDFTVHKLGSGAPMVLVVGGIQGDEPGGFSAASLLVTHYHITSGSVWVVPNLNFSSIIKRSRGLYGDMNRKFARLDTKDPEFETVRRIQEIIRTPDLGLVLNLHDGSGFFRSKAVSRDFSPQRWGQSVIVDMSLMQGHSQGNLEERAKDVLARVNQSLLKPEHLMSLKNTLTHLGNAEMEKSLSWYAVRNGIPAFGVEASKNFPVDVRTYYHLLVVEAFLKQAGITFERSFPLTPKGVLTALQSDVRVGFAENRILLPLDDIRPRLGGSIPLPKGAESRIRASKPILAVTRDKNELCIHYGNRTMTRFKADWRESDQGRSDMVVVVDGKTTIVQFGDVIDVKKSFQVEPVPEYRVNAIGASFGPDESGRKLVLRDFEKSFSVDKRGKIYRVETYKGQRITGMFLVRFGGAAMTPGRDMLPAIAGRETDLGM